MPRIITVCGDLKGQGYNTRHQFDTCLPITRQWKVAEAETLKVAERLSVPWMM